MIVLVKLCDGYLYAKPTVKWSLSATGKRAQDESGRQEDFLAST